MTTTKRPVVLVILDGWGIGQDEPGNAVLAASTPVMDDLTARYPTTSLLTSGRAVGLPDGQMGNSEVGHMNIGAGFVVHQSISRIDSAIESGELAANPVLAALLDRAREAGTTFHLGGLVSDGGVHSHTRHLVGVRGRLGISTASALALTSTNPGEGSCGWSPPRSCRRGTRAAASRPYTRPCSLLLAPCSLLPPTRRRTCSRCCSTWRRCCR